MTSLEIHTITPQKTPIGTVIWMHGLGTHNHDFDSLIPDLSNPNIPLKFIFPNAPVRPVTINHHMPTRAWYDVYSLTDLNREDHTGIQTSAALITQLIEREIENGTAANRIVLAGFSQGGAIALYTGVRQSHQLAGILALSCYLPLLHEHEKESHIANKQTPVLIAHGTHDMTLPCFAGKMAFDIVKQTHPNTVWREHAMGHEIASSVTQDIRDFFIKVYGK